LDINIQLVCAHRPKARPWFTHVAWAQIVFGDAAATLVVGAIAGVANVCCQFRLSNAPRASLEAECEKLAIAPHPHLRTFAAGHT
jgi:hypothetical protein